MYLKDFLTEVYVPLRLRGRSQQSVRLLDHAIRHYSRFLRREATLDDLEDLKVSKYLYARAQHLAPASVARERSGLVALWNLAQARGLVKYRPCLPADVCPRKTPRAFTEGELGKLFEAAGKAEGYVGPVRASDYFRALLAVAFETGERIHALLHTPQSGFRSPHLIVPAEVRKGGRQERVYVLSPRTALLLLAAADNDHHLVLHWPASDTALRKRWKTITRRAGLGDGPEVQFHAIRRSTASHIAAAGGDATAYLGHSSDKVTRKSYLDPRITEKNRPAVWEMLPILGRWAGLGRPGDG